MHRYNGSILCKEQKDGEQNFFFLSCKGMSVSHITPDSPDYRILQ